MEARAARRTRGARRRTHAYRGSPSPFQGFPTITRRCADLAWKSEIAYALNGLRRISQIVLTIYLVMGLGGVTPTVLADVFHAASDCCTDCGESDCPDQEGDGCPPQCTDCVCINYMSPMAPAPSGAGPSVPYVDTGPALSADTNHESPTMPGIFRPPRFS